VTDPAAERLHRAPSLLHPAAGRRYRGLPGVSMRIRVLLAVLLVLTITMVAAGLVVATLADRQTRSTTEQLLTSRLQLARQLAPQDLSPRQLVNRVDAKGVRATLILADSTQLGLDPVPGPRRSAVLAGSGRLQGAHLVLTADTALLDNAHHSLINALLITGVMALVVGALLALLATRFALAPLRHMASGARLIAEGQRGIRMNPTRQKTEVGQTATALDGMLDELEGAEQRAVSSARQTKDFLADAAHELRTPLAGISSAAETLLHQRLSEQLREELLVLLVREAQRGSRLVDDLLAIARLDAGQPTYPQPTDLLGAVGVEMNRITAEHPAMDLQLTGPQVAVLIDPAALQGILRNLLDNAARAAGPHGTVRAVVHRGDPVRLDVADSGPGVPDAERERIFDRMVRLDGARGRRGDGGSGLGLSIARAAALAAGGGLYCLPAGAGDGSHRLGGAVFKLTLPAARVSDNLAVDGRLQH